jgi:hypothetical protein
MREKDQGRHDRSAVDLLEEAAHLLRARPLLLAPYYLGTLPFVLGILYYWTHMSFGANAWRHCPQAAWGLTLLFVWMKTWQSIYGSHLLAAVRNEPSPAWPLSRFLRSAAVQTAIQPWGILVLPVALIVMIPFPQAFAFFQNVTLIGHGDDCDTHTMMRKAWRQASLWPQQNMLLLWLASPFLLVTTAFFVFVFVPVSSSFNPGVPVPALLLLAAVVAVPLCPLGMITALNIGVALFLLPFLLKTLFDVDTVFSLNNTHLMNNTFFAVVCSLSYLCLDPLMKACYGLRYFYGASLHTGDDLKVELRSHRRTGPCVTLLLVLSLSLGLAGRVFADSSRNSVSPRELDSAIESVIQHPEYTWRMPRETPPEIQGNQGTLHQFFTAITQPIRKGWNLFKKGLTKAWTFVREILFRINRSLPRLEGPETGWTSFSRAWIVIPLLALTAALGFLAWRARKQRRPRPVVANVPAASVPDLTREDVDASALPEDGWLNLAGELMQKGELRLALRALYLSTLAYLAREEWITLAKYKSDREYELELRRRSGARPDLAGFFSENRGLFERAWYGLHEVTPALVERFSRNQETIRTHAHR